MTYKYQIYTFQNGLGETVFCAKRVGWLPPRFTPWVEELVYSHSHRRAYHHSKWDSRDGVLNAIRNDAKAQDLQCKRSKRKAMKLIIVEDESVEVQ
jgi:hypothetical protein